MSNRVSIQDPIDGSSFTAEAIAAPLLLELSKQHRLTILEVYKMVRILLFGPRGADLSYDPFGVFDEIEIEIKRDSARLAAGPSIEDLFEIWERNRDRVAAIAARETDPRKRTRLLDILEEREATMTELRHRAYALMRRSTKN